MLSPEYDIPTKQEQTREAMSHVCAQHLEAYLRPWLQRLDAYVDGRIVGTLLAMVADTE